MLTFLSQPISSHTYPQRHNPHDTLPERESLWQRLKSWLWGFISISVMLPLTLEYIGKWRDLPSQETCQREVSTIMGGDSSVISRSDCMWGFCLWCVTFSEEIWTDIWSLRIGFQQQIEVTIPLKSSLFSQWVCWAYIQSMDERLLAGALVTQT